MRPNQYKDVVKEGKTFRIRKFTPEIASYWAFRLFGDLAAFGISSINLKDLFNGNVDKAIEQVTSKLPTLIREFTRMKREDFQDFQRDCLAFVDVKFDLEGFAPLVNSEGFFTAQGIPNPVLFELTTESFLYTIQDFFGLGLQDTSPEAAAAPSGQTSNPATGSNV